ncbi:hypothetical protein ACLIYM_24485 [Streptomyces fenghuangensis]|jgi:hypothetical protein|uniref:Sulfate adenylyltransferase subunit 1 n=2 Tax=Streptomyces TaxID=1883 RepID=A0A1H9G5E9_9ACTN|nr:MULTISPECIES: hypothetical protein [Streptomyces]MCG3042776.1 sulfate adenylyltransferase [Streptomyces sp. ICN903]MDH2411420.1 hypothetical protein [Streptomyces chitinivorans]URN13501.1 sulfate adenylyltransferase [Streptomyces radiopugnans]SEQ45273.1 hypothetical protein SAMN05216481_108104 [Streptomyces radiopugnans]
MGLLSAAGAAVHDAFSTFDHTGGRIGSGVRGSGQGGLAGCRR